MCCAPSVRGTWGWDIASVDLPLKILGCLDARFVSMFTIQLTSSLPPILLSLSMYNPPSALGAFTGFPWKTCCGFHGLVNQWPFLIVGHPWSQDSSFPSPSHQVWITLLPIHTSFSFWDTRAHQTVWKDRLMIMCFIDSSTDFQVTRSCSYLAAPIPGQELADTEWNALGSASEGRIFAV